MGFFEDMQEQAKSAKASGNGQYFTTGKYRAILKKVTYHKGHKGISFIAELAVKTAESTERDAESKPIPPVQGDRSYVVNMSDSETKDLAAGNVKTFLCSLVGEDFSTISPDKYLSYHDQILNPDTGAKTQPLKGKEIDIVVWKKEGKKYHSFAWSYVQQTAAEIKANRDALDK